MADVNHVILIGRLTRDAELKYVSSGQPVCKFDIAVNRKRKQGEQWVEEVHFFPVVLWGRTGETLNQYLVKGKQVAVEGELRQNRWEQDGQSRSKVEIMANNVQLLGGGQGAQPGQGSPAAQGSQGGFTARQPAAQAQQADAEPYNPEADGGPADFPDDIPF
jgi:single-strand DNA-binding protein